MEIEIKIENMTNPPEKMLQMYYAVAEYIREHRDISTLTVSAITQRAGIGKGTAYGYFSSKEELIANALMYEYSQKMQALAALAFKPTDFKERCYCIMDWIVENKEYNHMFSQIMGAISSDNANLSQTDNSCEMPEFISGARDYIFGMIDRFMEYGYEQKIFTEQCPEKRSLALLSAMIEYALVIMGPKDSRFGKLKDEDIREFIYKGFVGSLK